MKYETANVMARVCQRLLRRVTFGPGSLSLRQKCWVLQILMKWQLQHLEKKAPTLFSLFNVAEICSFLKPSPVQQKKLRASQDTNIMTFCNDLMAHHEKT